MNLAYRDVRHNLFRFLLTCVGLSLLLSVVLAMIGIYRGIVVDALTVARNHRVDLWVVEAGSRGPFAEASRIPGDSREKIAQLTDITNANSVTYQSVKAEHLGRKVRLYVIGFEPGRPGAPERLAGGRLIAQSHFEMVADRGTGLSLGDRIKLGRTTFSVVGLTENQGPPTVIVEPRMVWHTRRQQRSCRARPRRGLRSNGPLRSLKAAMRSYGQRITTGHVLAVDEALSLGGQDTGQTLSPTIFPTIERKDDAFAVCNTSLAQQDRRVDVLGGGRNRSDAVGRSSGEPHSEDTRRRIQK